MGCGASHVDFRFLVNRLRLTYVGDQTQAPTRPNVEQRVFNVLKIHSFVACAQPRSQGLPSLPPLVVGRMTLVAADHVTTRDTNFSTGVESTNSWFSSDVRKKLKLKILSFLPLSGKSHF